MVRNGTRPYRRAGLLAQMAFRIVSTFPLGSRCTERLNKALRAKLQRRPLVTDPLEEPSNQSSIESVSARLHLDNDRANEIDLSQLLRLGEDAQGSNGLDSKLAGGSSGTNFVNHGERPAGAN